MKFLGLEFRKSPKITVKNDSSYIPTGKYDSGSIFVYSPYMSVGEMLANTTLASCVYIIADAVASLSFVVYRNKNDSREKATNLPLYKLLARSPNENDSPFILYNDPQFLEGRQPESFGLRAYMGGRYYDVELAEPITDCVGDSMPIVEKELIYRYFYADTHSGRATIRAG